jgi:heat shock protein HslJ
MTHIAARVPAWRAAALGAALVIGLVAAACTGSTATPSPSTATSGASGASGGSSLEGTWALVKYTSPDGTEFTVPSSVTPTITFAGDAASGNAGCNTFNAIATVTPTTVSFSQVQSTKLACQDPMASIETLFLQALNLSNSYTVEGNTLTMSGPGGRPKLVFTKAT